MFSKSSIDFKNLHHINHSALIPLSRKFVSLPARFKGLVTTGDTFVWYGDKESDPGMKNKRREEERRGEEEG